jgi:outer membrane lipoprotein SlyB
MKQPMLMLASLLLAAMVSLATYNDTLSGSQTAAPEADGIALNLTAGGDLPGMSKVILQRDGQNVTGGTWRLTVLPQNADASSSDRGALIGTITGGTLTLSAEGTLASASAVQVTIQSGTGEYASVTSGAGTISISANAENPSQLSGTLVLNF